MEALYDDTRPVIPDYLFKVKAYRYRAARQGWKHIHLDKVESKKCPSQVRIITWNVSFDMSGPVERLNAALRHLETDILGCKKGEAPDPCLILLQEVNIKMFSYLLEDAWVRSNFTITPRQPDRWPKNAFYGNVTLVSRSICIVDCGIVHFGGSVYQRSGVIVDIRLKSPPSKEGGGNKDSTGIIRIINTHLESMPSGLAARRVQLDILSKLLFANEELQGGLIAGDMNSIGPNEHDYPAELGLRDAWKRGDNTKEAHTWGYQSPENYPAARLDKVLYLPGRGYKVEEPKRVGVGIAVKDPVSGEETKLYASDHYGLDTVLRMTR
ncbi:hypothetical protein AMATHDRAFT_73805 [Amanita thiersii Skay4041]|uniref:Endonuclease/exonuclease/phosphatase domain-containing protein n=1 Tax=Amanita thiersii Skay4041 TaxID=703135 RepID=A0A2A9NR20_9AGAR|nr:hypothetical protein AMATHDRAFT_73805 [Amanita thiersii Skay4041]